MSQVIEHHGTKGMKWGVRKDASRADKKWAKNIYTIQSAVAIHNNVADKMNSGALAKLNAAHPKAHLDQNTPATKAYLKAYGDLTEKLTAQAVKEVHGTSPTGGYKAELGRKDGELAVIIKATSVQHAIKGVPWETLIIPLEVENGKIVGAKNVRESISQSDMDLEDFIQHYGKKGMKWGVRRSRKPSSTERTRFQKSPKKLTSKELESRIKRMELEKKYNQLNRRDIGKGQEMATTILQNSATKAAGVVLTGATLLAVRVLIRKKFGEKGEEAASMLTKKLK